MRWNNEIGPIREGYKVSYFTRVTYSFAAMYRGPTCQGGRIPGRVQCQTHLAEGTGHCTWDLKKKQKRFVWREESVPVPVPRWSPVAVCWFFVFYCFFCFEKTWEPGWQTKDAWKRLRFSKKNMKKNGSLKRFWTKRNSSWGETYGNLQGSL